MSDSARLKWVNPFHEKGASSASEPTRFQPVSYNRNLIVGQIYVIAELHLKIDFPLNEPAPGQSNSYNQALIGKCLIN